MGIVGLADRVLAEAELAVEGDRGCVGGANFQPEHDGIVATGAFEDACEKQAAEPLALPRCGDCDVLNLPFTSDDPRQDEAAEATGRSGRFSHEKRASSRGL